MCQSICTATFTWVGSKNRPRNKIRTGAWAWTFEPLWSQSLAQFEMLKSGACTCRLCSPSLCLLLSLTTKGGGGGFNKLPHLGMILVFAPPSLLFPFQKQLVRGQWPPHARAAPTRKDSGITLAPTHASSFKTINQNIICTPRT